VTPFDFLNPMNWLTLNPYLPRPAPIYPAQASIPEGTPISIKGSSTDPGSKLTIDKKKNAIIISGTTHGAKPVFDDITKDFKYWVARGMGFSLDVEKAPTEDIFGSTNYTAKNKRLFSIDTAKGWSAAKCAEMLAAKVNDAWEFKATVIRHQNGSATIQFSRR
jgi:hypothetical protein